MFEDPRTVEMDNENLNKAFDASVDPLLATCLDPNQVICNVMKNSWHLSRLAATVCGRMATSRYKNNKRPTSQGDYVKSRHFVKQASTPRTGRVQKHIVAGKTQLRRNHQK